MNWLQKLFSNTSDSLSIDLMPILGFTPKNLPLYHQALCHRSVDFSKYGDNERLEFLGDSILNTVITEYLYHNLPDKNEGVLTDIRSKLVRRKTLNDLAKKLGVDVLVKTNLGIKTPPSIYGNAIEALIAAIYLDKGVSTCKAFIIDKMITPHFSLNDLEKEISSYKKHFLHWAQKNNQEYHFKVLEETGESHKKSFEIALFLDKENIATAIASSKKKAEEAAAKIACETLGV
ncbi:MAG: ribonuclease III [Flavobacteriales bacterium]|nr:ribonuclease III [Flavobacteriales bacterium]